MSASFTNKIGYFRFAASGTTSTILTRAMFEDAGWLTILAPASVNLGSGFTIQVTDSPLLDDNSGVAAGAVWRTLTRDNGAGTLYNVPVPGAGQAVAYPDLVGVTAIRLAASGAPNAQTDFDVVKNWIARG